MIDYKDFLFASPPRTGTQWFARAAYLAGFDKAEHTQAYSPFDNGNPSFRVSLVRHPCSWLASYHASQQTIRDTMEFLKKLKTTMAIRAAAVIDVNYRQPFDDFIREYLLCCSGAVGRLFNQYKSDTVMRLEDMPWAFIEFIDSLMPKKPRRDSITKLEKMNVSYELPKWDPGLRRLVIEAEKEICDKYEYY